MWSSSSTTILSAQRTELTRWAMMMTVVPRRFSAKLRRMAASVALSTALVESSRIKMAGCRSMARAMHSRCFWPPLTLTPPWPRAVSKPSGRAMMKS